MGKETIRLASGYEIPVLGLGTAWLHGKEGIKAITWALELGYRHFDTAYYYGNHAEIRKAVKSSGIDRSEIFLTSKIWKDNLEYEQVMKQADKIMEQLGLDYVDLLLVHWPSDTGVPIKETLSAFEELVDKGMTRSIGVSNFRIHVLEEALDAANIPLCINQVRYNPLRQNWAKRGHIPFCLNQGMAVTAYTPLAEGDILGNRILEEIGAEKEKSVVQVTLRWLLQKGVIAIPGSSNRQHLEENMDIFDWELTREEMKKIDNIPQIQSKS
jgi:diketogulonate reductase-like aldo/keto reductase